MLGILPGTVALVQATEALKILTGIGSSLCGRLLHYDALEMAWREFKMHKDPACPMCGEKPEITELIDYEGFCGVPSHERSEEPDELPAVELSRLREAGEDLLLLDVREPDEYETARIDGALLIPLGELEGRLAELEPHRGRKVVVHCHHGGRSAKACATLRAEGFEPVFVELKIGDSTAKYQPEFSVSLSN